jgi:hypothetical protein
LTLLGVYVQQVAGGDNLAGCDDLSDDTIRQNLQAANVALRFHFNLLVPVFTQGNGSMQADRLDPYLSEILASRRNWKRLMPKKEAFSAPMLTAMRDMAKQAIESSANGWLSRYAVLYDFLILGVFTGSRLAEFGQSNVQPGSKADGWNVIPNNTDVPRKWRGLPIAFMVTVSMTSLSSISFIASSSVSMGSTCAQRRQQHGSFDEPIWVIC